MDLSHYTSEQAAKVVGCSARHVRALGQLGVLARVELHKRMYLYPRDEVEALARKSKAARQQRQQDANTSAKEVDHE